MQKKNSIRTSSGWYISELLDSCRALEQITFLQFHIEPFRIINAINHVLHSSINEIVFWQDHVEGYHELSSKTQIYFSTAVANWDAEFYVKVDDDVHVNLG